MSEALGIIGFEKFSDVPVADRMKIINQLESDLA